jgi:hypothetical protein
MTPVAGFWLPVSGWVPDLAVCGLWFVVCGYPCSNLPVFTFSFLIFHFSFLIYLGFCAIPACFATSGI